MSLGEFLLSAIPATIIGALIMALITRLVYDRTAPVSTEQSVPEREGASEPPQWDPSSVSTYVPPSKAKTDEEREANRIARELVRQRLLKAKPEELDAIVQTIHEQLALMEEPRPESREEEDERLSLETLLGISDDEEEDE